jgi:hypothetical protein
MTVPQRVALFLTRPLLLFRGGPYVEMVLGWAASLCKRLAVASLTRSGCGIDDAAARAAGGQSGWLMAAERPSPFLVSSLRFG